MDDPAGDKLPIKLMVQCPGDNALADVEDVCFKCAHYRGMKSMRILLCSVEAHIEGVKKNDH